MTFYKSIPVVVEAYRFDGSGISAMTIMNWLIKYGYKQATFHEHTEPRILSGNSYQSAGWQAQLDLGIPHVKIAEVSDYIVRLPEKTKNQFRVLTEEHFKATYVNACGTCTGPKRETVGMVCLTCGHDYSKGL